MTSILSDIDRFLEETGLGAFRFGLLAARNGRLVERLRAGGRVWPETEIRVRAFIAAETVRRRPSAASACCRAVSVDPAKVSEPAPSSVSHSDAEAFACPETVFPDAGRKIARP